jgi:multidrug transporter EmrE-like cation transporter
MDDLSYGNIWKSLGVSMVFVAIGFIVFRHSEEARGVVALLCLVLAVAVLHVLDRRELRRKNED